MRALASIPLASISPRLDQPREYYDPALLAELAASIREKGLVEPLTVRPLPDGQFDLISGHRRLRACILAGLSEALCQVRDDLDDSSAEELVTLANLHRSDLLPWEEGKGSRLCSAWGGTSRRSPVR